MNLSIEVARPRTTLMPRNTPVPIARPIHAYYGTSIEPASTGPLSDTNGSGYCTPDMYFANIVCAFIGMIYYPLIAPINEDTNIDLPHGPPTHVMRDLVVRVI